MASRPYHFELPDPLIWQAGIEYGLQALAVLKKQDITFTCRVSGTGPSLEEVVLSVHQLGLRDHVRYGPPRILRSSKRHVVLLPRVRPLRRELIDAALTEGKVVFTSDPSVGRGSERLVLFPRRSWEALGEGILNIAW